MVSAQARAPCAPARCFAWGRLVRRGRGGIFSPVIHGYLQPDGFFLHRSIHHAPFGGSEVRAGSWACRVGALSRPLGPSCGFPKHFGSSKQVANVLVPCPLSLDKPEHGRPRPHGGLEGPGILRLYSHAGFFATVFCPCTHIPTALPAHALPRCPPGGGSRSPWVPASPFPASPPPRRPGAPRLPHAGGCGRRKRWAAGCGGCLKGPTFLALKPRLCSPADGQGSGPRGRRGTVFPEGTGGGAGRTMPSTYGPLIPTQPLALEAAAAPGGAGQDPAPAPGSGTVLQPRHHSAAPPGAMPGWGWGKPRVPGVCPSPRALRSSRLSLGASRLSRTAGPSSAHLLPRKTLRHRGNIRTRGTGARELPQTPWLKLLLPRGAPKRHLGGLKPLRDSSPARNQPRATAKPVPRAAGRAAGWPPGPVLAAPSQGWGPAACGRCSGTSGCQAAQRGGAAPGVPPKKRFWKPGVSQGETQSRAGASSGAHEPKLLLQTTSVPALIPRFLGAKPRFCLQLLLPTPKSVSRAVTPPRPGAPTHHPPRLGRHVVAQLPAHRARRRRRPRRLHPLLPPTPGPSSPSVPVTPIPVPSRALKPLGGRRKGNEAGAG